MATTCTVFMAATAASDWKVVFDAVKPVDGEVADAFAAIFESRWDSGGLPVNNSFTRTLVGRSAAKCVEMELVNAPAVLALCQPTDPSHDLTFLLQETARGIPESLRVQEYPPSPVLGYWLLDAIDLLEVPLEPATWDNLSLWISRTFFEEFSRVSARHVGLMDPVALAFSACLVERLRRMRMRGTVPQATGPMPSDNEVSEALRAVFGLQSLAGIWPKYFPLFHYPKAGANHCFSFELLESVLDAFRGHAVLADEPMLLVLERAMNWCEENRLVGPRSGWNSGGKREDLFANRPEGWATAAVYLFVHHLLRYLADRLQAEVLARYRHASQTAPRSWDELLDVRLALQGETGGASFKDLMVQDVLLPAKERRKGRRSALLFGPPGTSKTSYARASALWLDWPIVEITPSAFLRNGLANIYERADEIFEDLMDLERVVVFFDEMEALVQSREGEASPIDPTSRFLTTSMLPKLAELHRRGKVIVFMATNHQRQFDAAIKRPGRFDLLCCIPPPPWSEKRGNLERLVKEPDIAALKARLEVLGATVGPELDLFTVDEFIALLAEVRRRGATPDTKAALGAIEVDAFELLVRDWHKAYIALRPQLYDGAPNPVAKEFEADRRESRRQ